jgi:hypothetical protein
MKKIFIEILQLGLFALYLVYLPGEEDEDQSPARDFQLFQLHLGHQD